MLIRCIILISLFFSCLSCDPDDQKNLVDEGNLTHIAYNPTPKQLIYPDDFPRLENPANNPLTEAGVELGRRLFYDPILSADSTMSCASCHLIDKGFADASPVSVGIDGITGKRSAMPLFNVGFFYNGLQWDGAPRSLEAQAVLPVQSPIELHDTWQNVEQKLKRHKDYPTFFRKAFGIPHADSITAALAQKAIAQFQRTIISGGNSKYDRVLRGEAFFSDEELNGFDMFFDISVGIPDAECGHCHNGPLMTTNDYFNNGLVAAPNLSSFADLGRGRVTGRALDNGKFRAPSLRNIALTAPYMHDGRLKTLEEVIDHYNAGGHFSPNRDPLIRPLGLTPSQKKDIISFLHTLTDTSYLQNAQLRSPFK